MPCHLYALKTLRVAGRDDEAISHFWKGTFHQLPMISICCRLLLTNPRPCLPPRAGPRAVPLIFAADRTSAPIHKTRSIQNLISSQCLTNSQKWRVALPCILCTLCIIPQHRMNQHMFPLAGWDMSGRRVESNSVRTTSTIQFRLIDLSTFAFTLRTPYLKFWLRSSVRRTF
jgi:hypothetical protein